LGILILVIVPASPGPVDFSIMVGLEEGREIMTEVGDSLGTTGVTVWLVLGDGFPVATGSVTVGVGVGEFVGHQWS
jgi:hypothetical protein